jgi:hypothetical protein
MAKLESYSAPKPTGKAKARRSRSPLTPAADVALASEHEDIAADVALVRKAAGAEGGE